MAITVHFAGGPVDGKTIERQDAPLAIIVPYLADVRIGFVVAGRDVAPVFPVAGDVRFRDFMYRRRGPVRDGRADYDLVDDPEWLMVSIRDQEEN